MKTENWNLIKCIPCIENTFDKKNLINFDIRIYWKISSTSVVIHYSFEVIWFLTWKTVLTTCWDSCLPVQIETALINSSGDIALSARVYIFMAIWKSSRLLRNRQKSLNSSKVMPLRSRPSALSLCNLSASLSSIVSYSSVLRKVYLRRILAKSQGWYKTRLVNSAIQASRHRFYFKNNKFCIVFP